MKENIQKCIYLIKQEIKKIESNYNNYEIEFNIGDRVWYLGYEDIIQATVIDIDDWSEGGMIPGGMVYYWIEPDNAKLTFWDTLKYKYAHFLGKVYMPPKEFPGHAITAGYEFFRTKEEAIIVSNLYSAKNHLIELIE
jgi:hypothetical protein